MSKIFATGLSVSSLLFAVNVYAASQNYQVVNPGTVVQCEPAGTECTLDKSTTYTYNTDNYRLTVRQGDSRLDIPFYNGIAHVSICVNLDTEQRMDDSFCSDSKNKYALLATDANFNNAFITLNVYTKDHDPEEPYEDDIVKIQGILLAPSE